MSATLVNLIIQLLSGAAGSGVLARLVSQLNLGTIGNLITGALGGVGGGNILGSLLALAPRPPQVELTLGQSLRKLWVAGSEDRY